ncbi:MAG: RDD family protein [Caldilineaceae bacterium]|nr:RDD family protein [Caldilineaceae bacterium]
MTENWLQEEYTIDTPENVSFGYEIAGIGNRFVSGLVDSALIGLALSLLNILLFALLDWANDRATAALDDAALDPSWGGGLVLAIYALLNFMLIWGYYVLFELTWNGQTPGKRWAKVRVVRTTGNPAGFLDVVIRNLVRVVDFLPMGYGLGLTVMFFNPQARRLGDYAAGTMVIKERSGLSLAALGDQAAVGTLTPATPAEQDAWLQRFPALRRLNATDYELIQDALFRHNQGQIAPVTLHRLAVALAGKVGTTPPTADWQASRSFLTEVAAAYRQRP